jgi:DNA-directed RNA polymerase specialized sigma24 family protein
MNTTVIWENAFGATRIRLPTAMGGSGPFELVNAFGDRIYAIAKPVTQNDEAAADVLIETFLEVGSDWGKRQEDEQVWLRLVTIAVREALSHEFQGYSPERADCVLEDGLRSLDPMCRAVFVLRDIEEISVGDIAKIVNRSIRAVEFCLLRARLQLRGMLARQMRWLQ